MTPWARPTIITVKGKQIHLKVILLSTMVEIIQHHWNSKQSKKEIVNLQITLFNQVRPANLIKTQIFLELKVQVSSFKDLHRIRKIWERGNLTLLLGLMSWEMMRLLWKWKMELFIKQFRLVRKINGIVQFLQVPDKIRQIEKSLLNKMRVMRDFMVIKTVLINGKRKQIWQELLVKRLKKEKYNT